MVFELNGFKRYIFIVSKAIYTSLRYIQEHKYEFTFDHFPPSKKHI